MRIQFTRTTQEIGKIPLTGPTSRLVIQSSLNVSLQGAKFSRLL